MEKNKIKTKRMRFSCRFMKIEISQIESREEL